MATSLLELEAENEALRKENHTLHAQVTILQTNQLNALAQLLKEILEKCPRPPST